MKRLLSYQREKGMWPAFWMSPIDKVSGGWPMSREIDIVELMGSEPNEMHGNIHFDKSWPTMILCKKVII